MNDLPLAMQLAIDLDQISKGIPMCLDDRDGHERGIADLGRAVAAADPRGAVTEDWRGGVVRAFGIRATSTAGVRGAVSNWIRQVEAKSGLPLHRDPATNIGE